MTSPSPTPRPGISPSSAPTADGGRPATAQGATHIADTVVSKIAGVATRDVPGIHRIGGGAARALGTIRERIPGASTSVGQGVSVEVGEKQAAIDVDIVVEYGVAITDLVAAARRKIVTAVQGMTGLDVVEVNINVTDVHLPSDDSDEDRRQSTPARVA